MACPVCGKTAPVKKSLRGRLSLVCKWQDNGCGAQLQTLTADASIMMLKKVVLITGEPKGDEQQPAEKKPKGKKKNQAMKRTNSLSMRQA